MFIASLTSSLDRSSSPEITEMRCKVNKATSMYAIVVDDCSAMRQLEAGVLDLLGMETELCSDADSVKGIIDHGRVPDLLLLDWNIPGMNCLDLVKEIRDRFGEGAPFIMMVTAETGLDFVGAALGSGANDYLMKPFEIASLVDKLLLGGVITHADLPNRFATSSERGQDARPNC